MEQCANKSQISNKSKISLLGLIIIAIYSFFIGFVTGSLKPVYMEVDSYVLPIISIQYRQSLIIEQCDIDQAKIDFPGLYKNIDGYDNLRASKLNKIDDEHWVSFYFPLYAMLCLPIKLCLQTIGVNQIYCFPITNVLFLIAALLFVLFFLRVQNNIQRLLAVILLMASPVIFYLKYIGYEPVLYSIIIIALVLYQRGNKKTSAFVISVASWPNPTVMAIGIIMVIRYLVDMFIHRKEIPIFSTGNIKGTAVYAACFLPCFIPFIFNALYLDVMNPTVGGADLNGYLDRFTAYLFDLNLGIFSFAPILLLCFLALSVYRIIKKDFIAAIWLFFLISLVGAYALMKHINCGMLFCARYVVWTYPIVALGTVIASDGLFDFKVRYATIGINIALIIFFLCVNIDSSLPSGRFLFNSVSCYILDNVPSLYNPPYSTFYARNNHMDGGYYNSEPSYYIDSKDGIIRKILFCSDDINKNKIQNALKGNDESMKFLYDKLKEFPNDNKLHYININKWQNVSLTEKNPEEMGYVSYYSTIYDSKDILIESSVGKDFSAFRVPFKIKSNTAYKISLSFNSDCDIDYNDIFIDFNSDGYDSDEQQINGFYYKNIRNYDLFINSGMVEDGKNVHLRIISTSKSDINIDHMSFSEMAAGTFKESNTVAKQENINIESAKNKPYSLAKVPFTVKSDTLYRISFNFAEEYDIDPSEIYVDFYGDGYDNVEQQINNFYHSSNTEYCLYINSGAVEDGKSIAWRIISTSEKEIKLNHLSITEGKFSLPAATK